MPRPTSWLEAAAAYPWMKGPLRAVDGLDESDIKRIFLAVSSAMQAAGIRDLTDFVEARPTSEDRPRYGLAAQLAPDGVPAWWPPSLIYASQAFFDCAIGMMHPAQHWATACNQSLLRKARSAAARKSAEVRAKKLENLFTEAFGVALPYIKSHDDLGKLPSARAVKLAVDKKYPNAISYAWARELLNSYEAGKEASAGKPAPPRSRGLRSSE